MQQSKKKTSALTSDSLSEQLRSIPRATSKSLKNDLIKGGAKTAWKQFWGVESTGSSEAIKPREKIERKEPLRRAGYEIRQEIVLFSQREQEIANEIEAIRYELEVIIKTVSEVDFEVQKTVMDIPVKPGIYHVRFLERIKQLLKLIREKLEDSRTWLKLSVSKKRQRGYWALYKKKGTSFGLSGERVVATQTG